MEEKINFNELFGNDNSIVIRIERLLAGESFENLQKGSEDLLKFYIAQFSEYIDKCKQELKTLPPKSEDTEYQEYLQMLKLIENVSILNREDYKKLAEFSEKTTSSIENNMSRLSVIPNHNINYEEYDESDFEYNDQFDLNEDEYEDNEYFIKFMKENMILPKREQIEMNIITYEKELKQNQVRLSETLCLAINRDVLTENAEQVFSILKQIRSKTSKNIELVFDNDGLMQKSKGRVPYSYNKNELNTLTKLVEEKFVDKLYFSEFYVENYYPISKDQIFNYIDVYNANLDKNDFIFYNKTLNLSPFEFLLSAHLHIIPNNYEVEKSFNIEKCRTFLTYNGSYSFDDYGYVCSAFASHGKALVDDYGDKNLSCDYLTIKFYSKESNELESTHSVLLVKINDEKYNIKGHYIWDLSNDSKFFSIAYCLFPITDLLNYKNEVSYTTGDKDYSDYTRILSSPNKDFLTNEDKNYIYEKYKHDSTPINIKKYKFAVMNLLNKIEKSGSENLAKLLDGHSNSKEEYIENLLHDTILNLEIFDPQKSQNPFYKKMREFYSNTTNPKYTKWKKDWERCNSTFAEKEKLNWWYNKNTEYSVFLICLYKF